ncbi:hypothetical protein [Amycolatopsis samaneae]|uniref:XRE family transcriptional regulator n=1 Tax=Amycolatopsis samaneae TaxID=664691 RepID=A0ABW5GEE7_9PSEU
MRTDQAGGRYPPDSTPAQRELANLVDLLCRCMTPRTQAARARQLWISTSALSLYVNARRVPSAKTLERLHSLADQGGHAQLPCSLPELLELRELARARLSLSRFSSSRVIQECNCTARDQEELASA